MQEKGVHAFPRQRGDVAHGRVSEAGVGLRRSEYRRDKMRERRVRGGYMGCIR